MLTLASALLENCAGYRDGDEVAKGQEAALNAYFMRPRGDEKRGRSKLVSGSFSAMVEAVVSQAMDAFSGDQLAEFEPDGGEDVDDAQLESDAVTAQVMDGNNGYLTFLSSIKNAALLRNGIVKVGATDKTRTRGRTYRNVTPEAYAQLTAEKRGVVLKVIDWVKGVLRISENRPRWRLLMSAVAPENFVYTKNWPSMDLEGIPCCGERMVTTRLHMIEEEGFDAAAVNGLDPYIQHKGAEMARNPRGEVGQAQNAADPSLDQIEWYCLYITTADGVRKVCCVPNKALLEESDYFTQPYAVGAMLINPGRLLGVSLFDKLKQNWDADTHALRATADNQTASNKARTVYLEGVVNKADLEDGRHNANVGVKPKRGVTDVRQAVATLTVADITPGLIQMRGMLKQDRAELGGASLDLATGQAQLTERVGSEGLDRAYSVMEQLAGTMTRTIAETLVRRTYLLAHATMREYFNEPIWVKYKGKWTRSKPSEWPERLRLTIKVGMSPGERRRKLEALKFMLDAQLGLAREGMTGILVDMQTFYRTLMDWGRTAELPTPELYAIDPNSDASKQAQEQQAAQRKSESDAQKRLMNMALGMEQLRISLDKRKDDLDRVLEYFKAILGAQTKQAEVVGNAAKDFELQRREADALAESQQRDAGMLEGIDRAAQSLKELKGNGQPKPSATETQH